MRRASAGVVAMLAFFAPSYAEEKTPFDLALAAAERNARRPSGHAFAAVVGKAFGATYGSSVSACAKRVAKPDLHDFDLLVRLSMNGRIEEALVRPETNLAVCLRDELKQGSLPVPETANYWVRIGLKLKR